MPKRSKFSLSHYKLLTMNMGQLVPIGCTEVLPGDTFEHSTSVLVRASPTSAPVMHPVHIMVEHFFVPYRLIWNNSGKVSGSNLNNDDSWENFITGGAAGEQQPNIAGLGGSPPTISPPYVTTPGGGYGVGSLQDYLGIPPGVTAFNLGFSGEGVSALSMRAYNLIFNEYYRDEDLVNALAVPQNGGGTTGAPVPDGAGNYAIQSRAWQKDYFTTARPWAQKGPAVTLPLVGTAGFTGALQSFPPADSADKVTFNATDVAAVSRVVTPGMLGGASGTGLEGNWPGGNNMAANATLHNDIAAGALGVPGLGTLAVNLASATGVTIDVFRQALAVQRFEEMRARWGSRYTEYLASQGIRSSDARLQRPEFLGGGRQTLQWSEVLQTSNPGAPSGVNGPGALYGHGIGSTRSNKYRRFFEEHGVVLTLLSILPITVYSQSLDKQFSRLNMYDYFQREFQFVGQQVIKNSEVYVAGAFTDGTFGYQDRYDEYRREESTVAGQFRHGQTFEYWHLARAFAAAPSLNSSFVVSNPSNRVFLDQSDNQFFVMAAHSLRARRMLVAKANPRTF